MTLDEVDLRQLVGPDGSVIGQDGEVVAFEARGAVAQLFACRSDEVILSGPAGTGKSRGVLEFIHMLLSNFPHAKALVLRKTLVSLTESGLVTYTDKVLHRLDSVRFFGGSKSKPARFIYPNEASLTVGGLDNITKVMSTDYDIIFVQEATEITEDDHEMLTTRLRNGVLPFQMLVEDCNPGPPWHWILRRVREGKTTILESRHEDNPMLFNADGTMTQPGEDYMRRLDALSGVRKKRLRFGLWVSAEGVVYDEFDPLIHIVDPFTIPASWKRFRAIDFGFVNPFVCLWFALDPDNRLYCYREIYRTQTLVSDHAERIKLLTGKTRISVTVADHDSEDRATLQDAGVPTIKARKAIIPGIEAVQKRLRVGADGRPTLYFFRDARVSREARLAREGKPTSVQEEFMAYSWPEGTPNKLAKELPVDMDNHGMDALRYIVMYLDRPGRLVAPGGSVGSSSKWMGRHGRDTGFDPSRTRL